MAAAAAAAAKSAAAAAVAAAAATTVPSATAPGDANEEHTSVAAITGPVAPTGTSVPRRIQPTPIGDAGPLAAQARGEAAPGIVGAKRAAEAEPSAIGGGGGGGGGEATDRPKPKRIQPIPLSATALSAAVPAAGAGRVGGGGGGGTIAAGAAVVGPNVSQSSPGRRRIVPTRVDGVSATLPALGATAAGTGTAVKALLRPTEGLSPLQSAASAGISGLAAAGLAGAAPSRTPLSGGLVPGVAADGVAPGSAVKMHTPQVMTMPRRCRFRRAARGCERQVWGCCTDADLVPALLPCFNDCMCIRRVTRPTPMGVHGCLPTIDHPGNQMMMLRGQMARHWPASRGNTLRSPCSNHPTPPCSLHPYPHRSQVLVFGTPPSSVLKESHGGALQPRNGGAGPGGAGSAQQLGTTPAGHPKPRRVTPVPVDRGNRQVPDAAAQQPSTANQGPHRHWGAGKGTDPMRRAVRWGCGRPLLPRRSTRERGLVCVVG